MNSCSGDQVSLEFRFFRDRVKLTALPWIEPRGRPMNARKTVLLPFVVLSLSLLSAAQMHSTSAPSTASTLSSPGGQMGVQYGSSSMTLTATSTRSLADWRSWTSGDGTATGWVAPSMWATSSSASFPARGVKMAAGRPQEVVPPAARVQEHSAERVQSTPRIGQN
jgi:hypothetical protein